MVGAITVVEVIITDGATIGDIITIGEINLEAAASVGGLFHSGFRNAFIAVIRFISSASSWRVRLNVPQMRSGPIAMLNGAAPNTCGSRRSTPATVVVSSTGFSTGSTSVSNLRR
jgi:hypothetical protein